MKSRIGIWALALFLFGSIVGGAQAEHTWSDFHWARASNPVSLNVIDSVTGDWQLEFEGSIAEWNRSSVLSLTIDPLDDDSSRTRKRCTAVTGQIHVCNGNYGGLWYGMASINLDGDGHIIKGTAKINDSWILPAGDYNKNHLMCQEIGHLFGLGHTSEDGSVDGTCMDYSWSPLSEWPNTHDWEMLEDIYAHLDSEPPPEEPKACNPNSPKCKPPAGRGPEIPPMGVRVHQGRHHEIWVARGRADTLWIHHVRIVPEEYR